MSSRLATLLIIASLLALKASADCGTNPLGLARGVSLESSAAAITGTCSTILADSMSCCTQSYHTNIETNLDSLYDKIAEEVGEYAYVIETANDLLDNYYDEYVSYINDLFGGLFTFTKSSLGLERIDGDSDIEAGDEYDLTTAEWITLAEGWATDAQSCYTEMFNLAAALYCYSCEENWEDYMDDNDPDLVIYLQDDFCTSFYDSCGMLEYIYTIYSGSKLSSAEVYLFILESDNFADFNIDYETVDYLDSDYAPADDWETYDLMYSTDVENCADMDVDSDGYLLSYGIIIQSMLGIWGPSVYQLNLEASNARIENDELYSYVQDGDTSMISETEDDSGDWDRRSYDLTFNMERSDGDINFSIDVNNVGTELSSIIPVVEVLVAESGSLLSMLVGFLLASFLGMF